MPQLTMASISDAQKAKNMDRQASERTGNIFISGITASKKAGLSGLVREAGLEPAHLLQYRILSPGRLPIPPLPQKENRRGEI